MASKMIELFRANSSSEVEELIDLNVSHGCLDYKVNSNVQHQDLSWLRVQSRNAKSDAEITLEKEKSLTKRFQKQLTAVPRPRGFYKTGRWVKQA